MLCEWLILIGNRTHHATPDTSLLSGDSVTSQSQRLTRHTALEAVTDDLSCRSMAGTVTRVCVLLYNLYNL